jgi:MSHA pilin protein MshD
MWIRSIRHTRGMTLMELILAIVIIGVGLAGVLVAFNQAVVGSADPMVRKQMLAVAEEMMDEISLKPYATAANAAATGCARNTFNDVLDYNGYKTTTGICDIDGATIATLSTYNVSVVAAADTLPNGVAALRIAVTVTHGGTETFTLVGYRTDWAS